MPSKGRSTRLLYFLQILSALLGLGVSLYLLVQHTQLKSGVGGQSFCTINNVVNCDSVNNSRFSELGPVPLAAIGATFYFILLLLSVLAGPACTRFRRLQRWQLLLTTSGLAVDLGLLCVQLFVLKVLCLMCTSTYVAAIGVWVTNYLMRHVGTDSPAVDVGRKVRIGAIALAAFLPVLYFIPVLTLKWSSPIGGGEVHARIEAMDGDGTLGNPSAKVQIVEFSDFQCPHCRRAASFLHDAIKPLESRVHFIFKSFPLDNACNPALDYPMHEQACNLARLAVCATKKGKFWDYHDVVFLEVTDADIKKGIDGIAPPLWRIFSRAEIDGCLKDPSSLKPVSASIQLGLQHKVNATPTLLINGKPLTGPLTAENLQKLVTSEEDSAGK